MTDHNSPEAIAARANQEDPIIMYLIVRESLNMSIGKTAAQCAHASQMLLLSHQEDCNILDGLFDDDLNYPDESSSILDRVQLFKKWLDSSFRKVVLKADDKEWAKIKTELKDSIQIVVDAGLTEIEPGSETVIGVLPMYKSMVPKVIKRLQVLK